MSKAERLVPTAPALGQSMPTVDDWSRDILRKLLDTALAASNPARLLAEHLPVRPIGRCVVVGAGKAAGSMAAALEAAWPDVAFTGTVVAPYGYGTSCSRIRVREAGHPVPDANSMHAAHEILDQVKGLTTDDLVVALISGGGSAAMCLPIQGITLEDKQLTNKLLLASGYDIRTMNAVRRRLSAIKGGRLARAAAPARVLTLAISDIPGDDISAIASGPTIPCGDDFDFTRVVDQLGDALPENVRKCLLSPAPVVDCPQGETRLIATPMRALEAAALFAREAGLSATILGDAIEGESRDVACRMARQIEGLTVPTVLISGGETTVTVGAGEAGRGGRNTEFALSLAISLAGNASIWALACDTDGEDGAARAAGAIITPSTVQRGLDKGLVAKDFLDRHDSGTFFDAIGDLVKTGPTLTNVNDFRVILVLPQSTN